MATPAATPPRTWATAAGRPGRGWRWIEGAGLGFGLALGLAACGADDGDSGEAGSSSMHTPAQARLEAYETKAREAADFATIPASDGQLGADPYALIALPEGGFAGLLRGADRLVLLDENGTLEAELPTPHDPTDLAWRAGELLVVGTGEPVLMHTALTEDGFGPPGSLELAPGSFAPRALATTGRPGSWVWVADEGEHRLHIFGEGAEGSLTLVASEDPGESSCRGPIDLERSGSLLVRNCLHDHRLRFDRVESLPARPELESDGAASESEERRPPRPPSLEPVAELVHDGPIWAFDLGPERADGSRLIALAGVEDHPLERRDGGFGYIDSFVWLERLTPAGTLERLVEINVSELGVVTPKWVQLDLDADGTPRVSLAGYATPDLISLRVPQGARAAPEIERLAALPGTRAALPVGEGAWLAANPLFDTWLRIDGEGALPIPPGVEHADDRSFEERLGEALVFTAAMAPWNEATGKRSRFTCETCHFEGRGDGRVHFTGREFEGLPVHASSKPLLGLFPNRPHFSRALDLTMARMVTNEFRVANRHNGRDPWFTLTTDDLPWLASLPGWPGPVDAEGLRRSLMAFLMRWSMPANPVARGREQFTELEAEGARAFARRCESCHQARLVTDNPDTRVALGPEGELEPWRELIFSDSGPLVWASADYVRTGVFPWVHPEGARVPALRRLYLKWPYFTDGSARTLDELLASVRVEPGDCEHGAGCVHSPGPAPAGTGLPKRERTAIAAFLRLL